MALPLVRFHPFAPYTMSRFRLPVEIVKDIQSSRALLAPDEVRLADQFLRTLGPAHPTLSLLLPEDSEPTRRARLLDRIDVIIGSLVDFTRIQTYLSIQGQLLMRQGLTREDVAEVVDLGVEMLREAAPEIATDSTVYAWRVAAARVLDLAFALAPAGNVAP